MKLKDGVQSLFLSRRGGDVVVTWLRYKYSMTRHDSTQKSLWNNPNRKLSDFKGCCEVKIKTHQSENVIFLNPRVRKCVTCTSWSYLYPESVSWNTPALCHVFMFSPLEMHPQGNLIILSPLERHPGGPCITFSQQEGPPGGLCVVFSLYFFTFNQISPLEGNLQEPSVTGEASISLLHHQT